MSGLCRVRCGSHWLYVLFFFQAEDGIRDDLVTGVQTCALPIFEDEYRVYGAAITGAVRRARPADEVVITPEIGVLERQLRSFAPHLIISSLPAPTNWGEWGEWFSWVRLSSDPNRPSEIYVEGKRRESLNPNLGELLCVLEETEGLLAGPVPPAWDRACAGFRE